MKLETADELVALIHEKCLPETQHLKLNSRDMYQTTTVALYLTVLEVGDTVLMLVKAGRGQMAYPLLRTMYEAWVDLALLKKDRQHIRAIELEHHQYWLKLFNQSSEGNPFVKGLSEIEDFDGVRMAKQTEVDQLKNQGAVSKNMFQKHKALGWEKEYRTVYAQLCNSGHNNLQTLRNRHFHFDGDDDFKMVSFQRDAEDSFPTLIDTCAVAIHHASETIHEIFETGLSDHFVRDKSD
ncbi:DUF5677 domain-containing protein [Tateyamaria sp. Alg231-49]|uniref:DUF5677 domain-containing protein n=1 Tax=Tateyamaria sp. Alg231-49 TaxID=1922219 RepID=UPI000D55CF9C|nr:DUF5677 domain-containing protein [Tateyamaria sp. Alg231-49]